MKKIIAVILVMLTLTAFLPSVALATTDVSGIPDEVYSAIATGIKNFDEFIDISEFGITVSELGYVMQRIRYRYPLLYYVDNQFGYYHGETPNDAAAVAPVYLVTKEEAAEELSYVNGELDKIVASVPEELDNVEIAAYLHDYICLVFCYDVFGKEKIFDIYNMLKCKYGVCDAYTRLYIALLGKCGIEADGVWSSEMVHSWCEVKLGGEWYAVDVTWDDPVTHIDKENVRCDKLGSAHHSYFLKSVSAFDSNTTGSNTHRTDAEYLYPATSTKFDTYSWHTVSTPFAFVDGEAYCLDGDTMSRVDLTTGEREDVYQINEKWPVTGGGYWMGTFSGLGFYGDFLIYNTATSVMSLDPKTGYTAELLSLDNESEEFFYSVYVVGETLYYITAESPNEQNKTPHAIPLEELFSDHVAGDITGDGVTDNKDLTRLFQYLSGWSVEVDDKALDINGDDKVNNKDIVRLFQYLTGWEVEIY